MKNKILQGIEILLDEWDPVGILQEYKPIAYDDRYINGEYTSYIRLVIQD